MALNVLQTSLLIMIAMVMVIKYIPSKDVSNGFAFAVIALLAISAAAALACSIFLIWAN